VRGGQPGLIEPVCCVGPSHCLLRPGVKPARICKADECVVTLPLDDSLTAYVIILKPSHWLVLQVTQKSAAHLTQNVLPLRQPVCYGVPKSPTFSSCRHMLTCQSGTHSGITSLLGVVRRTLVLQSGTCHKATERRFRSLEFGSATAGPFGHLVIIVVVLPYVDGRDLPVRTPHAGTVPFSLNFKLKTNLNSVADRLVVRRWNFKLKLTSTYYYLAAAGVRIFTLVFNNYLTVITTRGE